MKEYVTDFDQLHDSMMKCKKNVSWKPSVKSFVLNSEENLHRMEDKLNRARTLDKVESEVKDEKIEDTLLDLANYAILAVIELKCKENRNKDENL